AALGALTVEEGAVAAAGVLDEELPAAAVDACMVPADGRRLETDGAIGLSADGGGVLGAEKLSARLGALERDQDCLRPVFRCHSLDTPCEDSSFAPRAGTPFRCTRKRDDVPAF